MVQFNLSTLTKIFHFSLFLLSLFTSLNIFLIFFNQWLVLKVSFYKYQSQPIINITLDLNSKSVKGVWDSFSYFIHFKIGDCRKLHFWHGHWFGEFILKERSQIFLLDWYSNGCWMFNLLIIFWVGKIWNVTIFSSLKHLELKSVKCGFGSAFPNPHLCFQTIFFFLAHE